jgi:hypothetical protein
LSINGFHGKLPVSVFIQQEVYLLILRQSAALPVLMRPVFMPVPPEQWDSEKEAEYFIRKNSVSIVVSASLPVRLKAFCRAGMVIFLFVSNVVTVLIIAHTTV